ncbi:amidohydrolase [uncultured Mucilaginibacter sp.]|uniref:amidohydrolase n=1 Tax=uncultured Mucilaginibacter sp. TaxID=797541 RepID=UPI0025D93A7F|nr:amidohydrolase [uncultured Mucilaginibacter sp.]
MKKLCLLLFCTLSIPAFAQTTLLKKEVIRKADSLENQVISWRRDFHEHPELGNNEVRTAEIIAKHLRALGLEVKTGIATTGVVGILRGGKPGPVVALRSEMDALPVTERTPVAFASTAKTTYMGQTVGVMHACGHDSHMAMLMAVAEILASMKSQLHGTVKFIFQPAEEGLAPGEVGGAEEMVKEGVLENPKVDVIFGQHIISYIPTGTIVYRPGGEMAGVNGFHMVVKGKSSHGAMPWMGTDPIVISAQIINNLQTIVSRNINLTENPAVVTVGAIKGGNRGNIIPDSVEMDGTLRSFTDADKKLLWDKVNEIATKTAEMQGATAKVTMGNNYPVTYNDPALTAKMAATLQQTAGAANVSTGPPVTGAEDFSFYQQKVPGLFFFLGGMPKGGDPKTTPANHSPDFFIDESGFALGVKALCNLTLDYMDMHSK